MLPAYLAADLLVVLHALYVGFVVAGLAVVWVGWARGWAWIRNFWFRMIHLAAIGLVAVEAIFGWTCPLTDWENRLREEAGQTPYPGDFLAYWAHRLLYWDAPQEFFWTLHILFFILVVATVWLVPPRWPGRMVKTPGAPFQD
jgi:hypothetical protein